MAAPEIAVFEPDYRELNHDPTKCVFSYDLDGNIIEINESMQRLTGYTRAESLHLNLKQLLDPSDWEHFSQTLEEELQGGSPRSLELKLKTKSGQRVKLPI